MFDTDVVLHYLIVDGHWNSFDETVKPLLDACKSSTHRTAALTQLAISLFE